MSTGIRLTVFAFLLSALPSSSASAQVPGAADQMSVELVNVDVRVRGADGQALADLPREAFRVYDEGEAVELTHFAWVPAVTSASGPDATGGDGADRGPGPRSIAIYLDEMHVGEHSRKPLLDALRARLATILTPEDRVTVVRYDGAELEVLLPWSNNGRELDRALGDLQSLPMQRIMLTRELDQYLELIEYELKSEGPSGGRGNCATVGNYVWMYAESARRLAEGSGAALLRFAQRLSREPGKRILLHLSEGMPMVAGGEVFTFAIEMCGGGARNQGVPGATNTNEDPSGEFQSDRFNPRAGAMEMVSYEMGPYWTEVAAHLNSLAVTVYPIQTAEAGSRFQPNVDGRIHSAAVQLMAQSNAADTLSLLARETGGLLVRAGRGLDTQLDLLTRDLGGYYSLAFSPRAGAAPGLHRIRVEVDRKGADLRYRQSYRLLGRDERVIAQLAEAVAEEHFDNPLDLAVDLRRAEGSGEPSLRIRVPFGKISLIPSPQGGQEGRITVFVALRGENGRLTSPRQRAIVARRADAAAQVYTYEIGLPAEAGMVAVAVVDDLTGTVSFARERLAGR
jgi:VWFA-related protein